MAGLAGAFLAALLPHEAFIDMPRMEAAIPMAGRGAALFKSRKVITVFGSFVRDLEKDRRAQQCRYTRKKLTW